MTRSPMQLYIGLAPIRGRIERYAQRFNLAEIRPGRDGLPRSQRIGQWLASLPEGLAFSVLFPNEVASLSTTPSADRELAGTLEMAAALRARWLVLQTPPTVMPSTRSAGRLKDFFGKLDKTTAAVAWDPRGVWQDDEAEKLAEEMGVYLVRDAARDTLPDTETVYCRVRGLGEASRVRMAAIERVADELAEREEAFVVFDAAENAASAAELLRRQTAPLGGEGPADEV